MGKFITEEGLKQLDKYKYTSGEYTWLDNALQPYWEYVVTLVPMWVAPNTITFVGWLCLLSSTVIILLHDFTFKQDIPSWCFFYSAVALWTYSTLDAIDGKQARRTDSSSPLGQLFDHGCDSFSVCFLLINIGEAAQLNNEHVFALFMAGYCAFWLSNWNEYNTGILLTNVGHFGVTECQVAACLVYILTGIFGQKIWSSSIFEILPQGVLGVFAGVSNEMLLEALNYPIGGLIAYYFGILIMGLSLFTFLKTLYDTQQLNIVKECLSLFVLMICCTAWNYLTFYKKNIGIVLFSFGLLIALLVCKIIISSVTKMKLVTFHKELVPLIVVTVVLGGLEFVGRTAWQKYVFWVFLVTIVCTAFTLLNSTIEEICSYLKIYCFSLQKRPGHPKYQPAEVEKEKKTKKTG